MTEPKQITKELARQLFEYRNGRLYWRYAASGRRADMCAMIIDRVKNGRKIYYRHKTRIGDDNYSSHYIIWNWHNGVTENAITFKDGDRTNCDIRNLQEVVRGPRKIIVTTSSQARCLLAAENIVTTSSQQNNDHCCPTCQQPVQAPTYDFIVRHLNLQPLHQRILRAVWDGKGHPVMPGRIFSHIYEDDPDGGPSDAVMYSNFKVALCRLRQRLEGSGVQIKTEGYRKGYSLIFEGKN